VLASEFGPIDVHMLQYSGAIWYPMVYDMPSRAKESFGSQKRQRQMDRARQYVAQVAATWVIPSAGPPCFLDPELRDLNDDHDDPANIFPDQMVFLDQMRTHGHDRGLLMMPVRADRVERDRVESDLVVRPADIHRRADALDRQRVVETACIQRFAIGAGRS
jgi:hypothetical protein